MIDKDGYPTEETLKYISEYSPFKKSISIIIDELYQDWMYGDTGYFVWDTKNKILELHTAGWSGNESIIKALKKSVFWMLFWWKTERGGHYYFQIEYYGDIIP